MKRKVIKQGAGTLVISLPAAWAKSHGLAKGDEIDIAEAEGKLVISKGSASQKRSTKLNLATNVESAIRTAIVNTYRAGYDIIDVTLKDPKSMVIITDTLRDYIIGFDVTKREGNRCIIENITEPSEEQFEILFRKIFFNFGLLLKITEERLKGKETADNYKDIVLKMHQYDNFCRRVVSRRNPLGQQASLFWAFSSLLIHAQREIYHLNRFLDTQHVDFRHFEAYNSLKQAFELLEMAYTNKDITKVEQLHNLEKKALHGDLYKNIQLQGKSSIVLYHIYSALRNLYLASSPLIGLSLER